MSTDTVRVYSGFTEDASRLVFHYADKFGHLPSKPPHDCGSRLAEDGKPQQDGPRHRVGTGRSSAAQFSARLRAM